MAGHTVNPVSAIASFSAATTLGIVTVITPGGVGVREGALSALLVTQEFTWATATAAALAARLWFIAGETCVFLIALRVRGVLDA